MEKEYVEQTPYELTMNIINGKISDDQFQKEHTPIIISGELKIKYVIIGESHLVEVEGPSGDSITEVVACVSNIKKDVNLEHYFSMPPDKQYKNTFGCFDYKFSSVFTPLLNEDTQIRITDLRKLIEVSKSGVEILFPKVTPVAPLTSLCVRSSTCKVEVLSVHTYPTVGDNGIAFFTESTITWRVG